MITLTFGKNYPGDQVAKKLLDNFLKRLRRFKNIVNYLWVAEKQRRGAIHFHILTEYTEKDFINSAWNEIVQSWQSKNGFAKQIVYPNVISVTHPSRYLSKYLTKSGEDIIGNLYGMSQNLSSNLKPIFQMTTELPNDLLMPVLEEALSSVKIDRYIVFRSGRPFVIWAKEDILKLLDKINLIINTIN